MDQKVHHVIVKLHDFNSCYSRTHCTTTYVVTSFGKIICHQDKTPIVWLWRMMLQQLKIFSKHRKELKFKSFLCLLKILAMLVNTAESKASKILCLQTHSCLDHFKNANNGRIWYFKINWFHQSFSWYVFNFVGTKLLNDIHSDCFWSTKNSQEKKIFKKSWNIWTLWNMWNWWN